MRGGGAGRERPEGAGGLSSDHSGVQQVAGCSPGADTAGEGMASGPFCEDLASSWKDSVPSAPCSYPAPGRAVGPPDVREKILGPGESIVGPSLVETTPKYKRGAPLRRAHCYSLGVGWGTLLLAKIPVPVCLAAQALDRVWPLICGAGGTSHRQCPPPSGVHDAEPTSQVTSLRASSVPLQLCLGVSGRPHPAEALPPLPQPQPERFTCSALRASSPAGGELLGSRAQEDPRVSPACL